MGICALCLVIFSQANATSPTDDALTEDHCPTTAVDADGVPSPGITKSEILINLLLSSSDDGGLTQSELADNILTFVLAGHETTTQVRHGVPSLARCFFSTAALCCRLSLSLCICLLHTRTGKCACGKRSGACAAVRVTQIGPRAPRRHTLTLRRCRCCSASATRHCACIRPPPSYFAKQQRTWTSKSTVETPQ